MQVKAENLSAALSEVIAPLYLISGDETLLVEEACDAVLRAAAAQGYTERSVHHVDTGFKWHELQHDAASLSLFAERKVLDVRVPAKKLDREASEVLREWAAQVANQPQPETVLLLRTGRLEPGKRNSAWFKALDQAGVVTLIWPLAAGQLPSWLKQRGRNLGLAIDTDALQYLSDRVEGNLLAAAQELEKLALMNLAQPVSLQQMVAALEDAARFNSFDLLDAVMAEQPVRVTRILQALRDEGVALFAILGALTSQMRRLPGTRGLPPARQRLVQQFARRIRQPARVLAECAIIDQQGKGQLLGDPWISLHNLLLRLAGQRRMPLPSEDQRSLMR